MRTNEFKEWLQIKFPDTKTTVNNRISNCNHVEKYYGDLDTHYTENKCSYIIDELNYSTEDERKNASQRHKVPIDGNIRNGSATLKLAVKLYVEFRENQNELLGDDLIFHEEVIEEVNSDGAIILQEIRKHLSAFNYKKITHNDIAVLQLELTDFLNEKLKRFTWKTEHRPSLTIKDSIDIFGLTDDNKFKIVIELDAHRADQVAKKFISRSALFINDNIIYLSICYPGTSKMNKNECIKYFDYCAIISRALSDSSGNSKLYAGIILE
ncbi:hypothetical protein [Williamwhitmania taraxaci]|nr:hypothetical protein [Williamwhitmania taraxaci]